MAAPDPITILNASRQPIVVQAPAGFGQRARAEAKSVAFSTEDLEEIAEIRAKTVTPSFPLTRAANTTAYSLYDYMGPSSFAPLSWVVGAGAGGRITGATMETTDPSIVNALFRVHLFTATPTNANADNGAFSPAFASGRYLGSIDIRLIAAGASKAMGEGGPNGNRGFISFSSAVDTVYGLVETREPYAPSINSGVYTFYLDSDQN